MKATKLLAIGVVLMLVGTVSALVVIMSNVLEADVTTQALEIYWKAPNPISLQWADQGCDIFDPTSGQTQSKRILWLGIGMRVCTGIMVDNPLSGSLGDSLLFKAVFSGAPVNNSNFQLAVYDELTDPLNPVWVNKTFDASGVAILQSGVTIPAWTGQTVWIWYIPGGIGLHQIDVYAEGTF